MNYVGSFSKIVCFVYREQQRSVAEREFVYHKMNLLTQTDFGKKLEDHLYQKVSNFIPPIQSVAAI